MMEYGLIGERLGHSYSPRIHRVMGHYDYQLYPMSREELIALYQTLLPIGVLPSEIGM